MSRIKHDKQACVECGKPLSYQYKSAPNEQRATCCNRVYYKDD